MPYSVRGGKLVKSGTTVTTTPYVPPGYRETEAEQRLQAQGRIKELVPARLRQRQGEIHHSRLGAGHCRNAHSR